MSKIKELLDDLNRELLSHPDWIMDAEYREWVEWAEKPFKIRENESE